MRPLCIVIALALGGCSNKKDVEHAKHSVYDTDFAVVYNAALEATRELYPNLDDTPGNGAIHTAWHQVQYANNQDDLANQRTVANAQGINPNSATSPAAAAAGMPTRLAYKRYFIRFDVAIAGGRPWRVKVTGHASEWEPGNAMPVELHGMAKPHWLEGRTEALQLAIYKRMRGFALPAKDEPKAGPDVPEDVPHTDPTSFTNVPDTAAKRLAQIKDALAKRDYTALRAQLADDLRWSAGGEPDASTAMAMWQADPDTFTAMGKLIDGGSCGADADKKHVKCPAADPPPGTYQLTLELRGDTWKVTSFLKVE
jgi:hypothetical protein